MKFPQEYDEGGIIILDDLNEREMNDPRVQAMFKRSRQVINLFSLSAKITMNYQRKQLEPMEIYITYSNQIISEMYKIFMKTKLPWI